MTQSTELSAGSGFTFENLVAARYLAALLTETGGPGADGIVVAVALQQRAFGEPLDDVIVDFQIASGALCRLGLQCKASLTISNAASNADFREVIRDGLKTLQKPDFRENLDRYGAAVSSITTDKFDALTELCSIAQAENTPDHFSARFASGGNASHAIRQVNTAVAELLKEELGADFSEAVLFRFLRHFVLVRFDTLHPGAVDSAEAVNAVRPALAPAANAQAAALWATLCEVAREEAARAARFSRTGLLLKLNRTFALIGAPSLRDDLNVIAELAAAWVRDIDDDVRGTRLSRDQLSAALDQKLTRERFVQVRGLPGSGKSVLLRHRIEADLQKGPVLFLKSDRLEGKSWVSFAKAFGLTNAPLVDLLVELAQVGSSVLYIDGIDRIEKAHQGVIADLVRTILTDPLLTGWRVVISLRDAGTEPLRTWLPDLFEKGRLGTIDVALLNETEARELAEKRPELRSLLFGSQAVREIVRRPFFAKILSDALVGAGHDAAFAPVSEVDLLENWWARGGFNANSAAAIVRQRAVVELAAARARDLSQPLLLAVLSSGTINELDALITDGILQWVRPGHSVRFAHDIFFEWALFHRLVDCRDGWLDEVKAAGEPPMIGRVVELLSQADFVEDRGWEATLTRIEASNLRSQWLRAWLVGPVFAPNFEQHRERYFTIGAKDGFRLLAKALVWFQAEKTVPNAAILDGRLGSLDLTRHDIVRLADTLGWPSDYAAWRRLIGLLLDHIADVPLALIPDVVVVLEVWQNACSDIPNVISSRLLAQCATWVDEIEAHRHKRWDRRQTGAPSRWDEPVTDLEDLEHSLRALVLRGAQLRPDLVTAYLKELSADVRRLGEVFADVVRFAPFFSRSHTQLLVEVSLLHFKDELPEDRIHHKEESRRHLHERRKVARAKPESERTREDELVLSGPMSVLGSPFSSSDWDNLAIHDEIGKYFPASPLREPFHSLFQAAPNEALRLIKDLSNHAMLAWRQLHRLDPQQRALRKPIPISLEFPWGTQQFFGADHEYIWFRGLWAPHALACAYQATERWALEQLNAGRTADEVIQEIVTGDDSIAALGIAVSLMLKSGTVSQATLPLITSQRLWRLDLHRKVQEGETKSANQIGWRGEADRPHYEAVRALNDKPHRTLWLRDFVANFLLGEDVTIANKARAIIAAFAENLPFEYEEQRADPNFAATLEDDGRFNAEFAKPENVKTVPVPGEADKQITYIDNPKAREPETRKRLAVSQESQNVQLLWFWADKSLKESAIAGEVTGDNAVAFAKKIDDRTLFTAKGNNRMNQTMRQGAVAGTAAVVLKYRDQFGTNDIRWAAKIALRASRTPEVSDGLWSNTAIIRWHPGISAAKAMGFQVRAKIVIHDAKVELLRLIAHPLDGVAIEALRQSLALWDIDPRFAWCATWEALALCQFTVTPQEASARVYNPAYIAPKRAVHAEEAIALFEQDGLWPDLPPVPPAWVKIEVATTADGDDVRDSNIGDDDGTDDVAASQHQWRQPDTVFDWNLAAPVLAALPVDAIAAHVQSRERFLRFTEEMLSWVSQQIAPPWKKRGRRERSQRVGKLGDEVARLFARLAVSFDTREIERIFLAPVFGLENEPSYELLGPFIDHYVCLAVYDTPIMPANVLDILQLCTGQVLKDRTFDPTSHHAGEMHGYRLPYIMRALLLVSADNAPGAARFANGDWSELPAIMPVIDRIVNAAGWASGIMSDYLTMVERARGVYPTETFADQILMSFSRGRESLKGWRSSYLAARIAGLVQSLAFRDSPLSLDVARKLLCILDILVDMGDRRSAALQISEPFRGVRSGEAKD